MKKYRKSLLSIAASVAIASSMLSGGYLPLTDATNDDAWILMGVSAFGGSQEQNANAGEFSITTSGSHTWTDDDNTDGLGVTNDSGFGTLEALGADPVEVRVNTTGVTLSQTDPVRRIYVKEIKTDGTDNILFSFEYKASLEGAKLEYAIENSTTAYYVMINSDNTYDNPALGVITEAVIGDTGESLVNLKKGAALSAVDFNLSNNPIDSKSYDVNQYRDEDDNDSLRMYNYDPSNGTWNLFDTRNTDGSNDFTTLERGRGYWASMDTNGDRNISSIGSGQIAGLVLGDGATSIDYSNSGLVDGWNLISFDSQNTEIRRSTTGILATFDDKNATVKLYDSSMGVSVSFDRNDTDSDQVTANKINYAITLAKLKGELPRVFDLKAFATNNSKELALISNKRFGIEDTSGNAITNVSSMTDNDLLDGTAGNPTFGKGFDANTDPGTKKIMSVYNEYFLVIEPLVGSGTAAGISASAAKLDLNLGTEQTIVDINNTLANVVTALGAVTNVSALSLDINASGTPDYALIAATEPFYIRDYTPSRVFKYVDSDTNGTVKGYDTGTNGTNGTTASIGIQTDGNATKAAADINSTDGLSAQAIDNEYLVVVALDNNKSKSSVDFQLAHFIDPDNKDISGDNLAVSETVNGSVKPVTTTSDLAKGAVKAVYSLDAFIKQNVVNTVDINVSLAFVDDANVTMSYLNMLDFNATGTEITGANNNDIAAMVIAVNADLKDQNITATVTELNSTHIRFTSSSLINAYADINSTGASTVTGVASLGNVNASPSSDITDDLKYNSAYSPNYVKTGPLYTMRKEGFKLEALITGVTDKADDGKVYWESVDLTRPTHEWLDSQDYNLFDTDERSGYWAKLSSEGTNDISITNTQVAFTKFTHYYDVNTSSTYASGTLDMKVNGISTQASEGKAVRVVATIGGEAIELTNNDALDTTLYTGKINMYEIDTSPLIGKVYDIEVNVYDGIGNTYSTKDVVLIKVDALKPEPPVVSIDSGIIVVEASPSEDVAAYYTFEGKIPETYSKGDEKARNATAQPLTGVCEDSAAVTISSPATGYNVVAVDGNDTGGMLGNVSDIAGVTYMPIAKSRVLLADTNDDDGSTISTGGSDYNSSCEVTATPTTNEYGVSLTSETRFKNVKIAFTPDRNVDSNDLPITVFVTDGTNIARIDYVEAYVGDEMFFFMDGKTYGMTFPTRIIAENTSDDTSDALTLTNEKLGVKF